MTPQVVKEIAVVVRYTQYESDNPEHRIALKAAYFDIHRADDEARRLNDIAADDLVRYFVKIVKLTPT